MCKKLFFALILILVLSNNLEAQIKFGVKGGVNIAKEKFKESSTTIESANTQSFHAGVFLQLKSSKYFSFQPELVYSREGGEFNDSRFRGNDELNYINLPLLIKFHPIKYFNLVAGPQLGFLHTSKGRINGFDREKENYKPLNTSIAVGAGINVSKEFEFYARYNIGFENINEIAGSNIEITLQTLQFGIAISLVNKD